MSLHTQFLTVLSMFAAGLSLGTLFDVYRVLGAELRLSRWVVAIVDLVYWIVATVFVFYMLYTSNSGQLRLFVLLALAMGMLFYFTALSPAVIRLIKVVIRIVKAITRFIIGTVNILIVKPIRFIYRLLTILFGFFAAASIFTVKVVIQLFHPITVLGKWLWKPFAGIFVIPPSIRKGIGWIKRFFKRRI